MKRIAIVTSTRAEYGLLSPLINKVVNEDVLDLDLIVTGAHLSDKQGYTVDEIEKDGNHIAHRIDILDDSNTPYGVSCTLANATKMFAKCFRDDRPDLLVVLGDRTEMMGVALAAMNEKIPIAHIHGGEITEGAVDDSVRHSLTKLSYLHFTCTEEYRNRVIQLGEAPDRVFNVGSLGAENILNSKLLNSKELQKQIPELSFNNYSEYGVLTYHPVTLDKTPVKKQIAEILIAMEKKQDIFFVITASNADVGGDEANYLLKEYANTHENAVYIYNLGMVRYLSTVRNATFVLGNSSSGILEAPVLGTPSINIGDRQSGRIQPDTVINCSVDSRDIVKAMEKAMRMERQRTNIYGDGDTSDKVIEIIKDFIINEKIDLKKGFYDIKLRGE